MRLYRSLLNKLRAKRRVNNRISRSAAMKSKFQRNLSVERFEERLMLTTFLVNRTYDISPGDYIESDVPVTLREAIERANQNAGPDTIHFDPTVFGDGPGLVNTITLGLDIGGFEISSLQGDSGELFISEAVTIDASGQDITIDANGTDPTPLSTLTDNDETNDGDGSRVFHVKLPFQAASSHFEFVGLTLTGGDVSDNDDVDVIGDGGAILVDGHAHFSGLSMTLREMNIEDNHSTNRGGGVAIIRTLLSTVAPHPFVLEDVTLQNNTAEIAGGGLYLSTAQSFNAENSLLLLRSQVLNNHVIVPVTTPPDLQDATFSTSGITLNGHGGGIAVDSAGGGPGGVRNMGLTIEASTVAGNTATNGGGGVFVQGVEVLLSVSDTSIYNNSSQYIAGGIYFCAIEDGRMFISNSTISGNLLTETSSVFNSLGGGIFIAAAGKTTVGNLEARFNNTTITENAAERGAGIFGYIGFGDVPEQGIFNHRIDLTMHNNIVALNKLPVGSTLSLTDIDADIDQPAPSNVDDRFIEAVSSHNLVGSLGSLIDSELLGNNNRRHDNNDFLLADLQLGPLDHNGGFDPLVKTHALLTGSIAIDAGDDNLAIDPGNNNSVLDHDQRGNGFDRKIDILGVDPVPGQTVDIGAFEVQLPPPTITDVRLDSSGWAIDAFSFKDRVADNDIGQYRSISTAGANILEVVFSEDVTIPNDGSGLELKYTVKNANGGAENFTIDSDDSDGSEEFLMFDYGQNLAGEFVGTWTFDNPLENGKYSVRIDPTLIVSASSGASLDAFWDNDDNNGPTLPHTPDNVYDDMGRSFDVGDGNSDSDIFQFNFAYLKGDYDGDHVVNMSDLMLHQSADPRSDGDGDGEIGVSDGDDLTIYNDNINKLFALRAVDGGDFNDDEVVNLDDYAILLTNLHAHSGGGATPELGDITGDGYVDYPDVALFKTRYLQESVSAWYEAPVGGVAAIVLDSAPVVTNVTISGSNSTDAPYSFSSLLGTGEQLRSVPVAGADTVSVQFSEEISLFAISQSSLQVTNLDGTSPITASGYSYDPLTQTATWSFASPFEDGRHLFSLANGMADLGEQTLDGEVENPWSLADTSAALIESGDGSAGGDFRFRATILANDTDRDNIDGATDYTNWASYEPGMIYASNTVDEIDGDLSFGDVSLREAVQHANNASELTTIVLPEGRYSLTRFGTEVGDGTFNDLDITGDVTVSGAGPGLTVVEATGVGSATEAAQTRIFSVEGVGNSLHVEGLTFTGVKDTQNSSYFLGGGILALNGATLLVEDSVFVDNSLSGTVLGVGVGISSQGAHTTVLRSVFTANQGYAATAIYASPYESTYQGTGTLTIGDSLFALNQADLVHPNVFTHSTTLTNLGGNLYDDAGGGFFDTTPGVGDHLGTTDFVVTTVADTFDHADDNESLSLREAVDLANTNYGSAVSEIWLPAWDFVLTRDRGTNVTDTDVSYGDLDIYASLVIRGVTGVTSVAWTPGVVDAVFDLLGDFTGDGINSADDGVVDNADYDIWLEQVGSSGGVYSADADDNQIVDSNDYSYWSYLFGNTLDVFDVLV